MSRDLVVRKTNVTARRRSYINVEHHWRRGERSYSPSCALLLHSPATLDREAIFVMEINITLLNGQSHPLIVDPGTTVGSLKTLIFERFTVSVSQRLLYNNDGQRLILDDTSKSLRDYGLPLGADICVLVTEPAEAQVFLKTDKGTHTYTVSPGETVGNFKRKVRQREGVAEDQQRLIHEGKQMDEANTLESYNVKEESTIYLNGRLRGG